MAVAAQSFQRWLSELTPGISVAEVCRKAGIKRTTLAQQLVRGKVSPATIVAVARAFDVEPVQALGAFEGYRDLPIGTRPPRHGELISQVSTLDILRFIVARSDGTATGDTSGDREDGRPGVADDGRPGVAGDLPFMLGPLPHEMSVRTWIEAVDPGDLRQRLARDGGIAPQNLSAQLSSGRLSPELAVHASRIAGVSLASGLVVIGLLRPSEGAWRSGSRLRALAAMSDAELAFEARDRLDFCGKAFRKSEQADARDKAIWENLG